MALTLKLNVTMPLNTQPLNHSSTITTYHWLNGVKVVSIKRGSERWQTALANSKFADWVDFGTAEEGYIALQDHGDPVWYRNIRVRRLTE